MARKINRRGVVQAIACAALVAAGAGCQQSADHVQTTSGTVGDIRPGGQDIVVGEGGNAVVIPGVNAAPSANPPSLGQKINDDFVLSNGMITIGVDGVGMDLSSPILNSTASAGVPIENTVAPSGGNLVDISINGRDNDNWVTNGIGVIGVSIAGGKGAFTPPDNLVFWFEVIPESSTHTADVGLEPIPGSVMRRLICRGVILNNRSDRVGVNEAVDGAATNSAFTVKTLAPSAAVPASFRENVPDRLNILVHTIGGADVVHVPIFVTQVYTVFEGSPVLTESTVIQHAVAGGDAVRIGQAAEFIGLGAAGNSSLDTLTSGPMWVDPAAVLAAAPLPGPAKAAIQGLLPARPSVTTGELNAAFKAVTGGVPAFPGDSFGQGVCQWVSFIGRGEPAISYTLFDPLAGGLVFNRDPRQSTIGLAVQLRSDPTVPADNPATTTVNEAQRGRLAWARKIAVANSQDSAASSDVAVQVTRQAPRAPTFTPNSIFAAVEIRGHVSNAPEGTIIVVSENNPTFFNTFNPTVATPSALPASSGGHPLNNPSILGQGLAVPFAPHGNPYGAAVPLEVGITLTASVTRATRRPAANGDWSVIMPAGAKFQAINPFNQFVPQSPPIVIVNDTTSSFSVKAVLPGGGTTGGTTSISLGTVVAHPGDDFLDIGDHDLTSVGTVNFTIRDSVTNDLIPGFVTILTQGGTTPFDDFSFPTGLEEGLERSKISGNVGMTASGAGSFVLAPGKTYTLLASAGPDYETDSDQRTIATGTAINVPFQLVRVGNATTRDHVSGDFHMHSGESPDSGVPSDDRVRSLLAEGIEVYAQTEHDKIGNHAPAINRVRIERPDINKRLKHMYGEEFTTDLPWLPVGPGSTAGPQCIGHFNCYPETYRAERRKGGAPDDELRPPGVALVNMRMTDGVFIVTSVSDPIPDTNEIVQLNHPRSAESSSALDGGDGFFSNLAFAYPAFGAPPLNTPFGANNVSGLSPVPIQSTGIQFLVDGGPTVAAQPPAAALAPLAAVLKGSMGFDTMEVLNGSQSTQRYLQHRADWFAMLNRGVIKTAVGTSDSHRIDDRRAPPVVTNFDVSFTGIARTYLLTSSDPDQLTNAQVVAMLKPTYSTPTVGTGSAVSLANPFGTLLPASRLHGNRQKAIVSTGPMITVSVSGGGVTGTLVNPIGQAVSVSSSPDVTVSVSGPTWVLDNVHQLRLVVNGVTSSALEFDVSGTTGVTVKSHTFPAVDLTQNPIGTVAYAGDTWVVAEVGQTVPEIGNNVSPAAPYSQVYPGVPVVAFTNPIFFDRDGNLATFDACANNE